MITLWIKPDFSDGQFLVIKKEKLRTRQHIEHFLLDNFDSRNTAKFEKRIFSNKTKAQIYNYNNGKYKTERLKIGDEKIEFAWVIMTEKEYENLSEFEGW
jgi:hypothetical protein